MEITTLGIDLAKSVFQLHGTDAGGNVVLRKRLRRNQVLEFMASLPRCAIRRRSTCCQFRRCATKKTARADRNSGHRASMTPVWVTCCATTQNG